LANSTQRNAERSSLYSIQVTLHIEEYGLELNTALCI
jgi:hypothetical protein